MKCSHVWNAWNSTQTSYLFEIQDLSTSQICFNTKKSEIFSFTTILKPIDEIFTWWLDGKQFCGSLMFETDPNVEEEKFSSSARFCLCPINRIMRHNFRSTLVQLAFMLIKFPQKSNLILRVQQTKWHFFFYMESFQQNFLLNSEQPQTEWHVL